MHISIELNLSVPAKPRLLRVYKSPSHTQMSASIPDLQSLLSSDRVRLSMMPMHCKFGDVSKWSQQRLDRMWAGSLLRLLE